MPLYTLAGCPTQIDVIFDNVNIIQWFEFKKENTKNSKNRRKGKQYQIFNLLILSTASLILSTGRVSANLM